MGGEDNIFARLGRWLPLLAGDSAEHLLRYPSGPVEPIYFSLRNVGTYPGSARIGVKIYAGVVGVGTLARAAGMFPLVTGSLLRATGFFLGLGEVLPEPIVRLIYRGFFSGRDLWALAVSGAGREFRQRVFGRHFWLSSEAK
jgi:hypothetical protein